jgi:5'-deoxynucleotidase YfbR-like HD superfamily hydrolase
MRKGNWIQTYSGLKMYPLDPLADEICLADIAHALSNICRFTGHSAEFYSVAQHSVYVSSYVSRYNALWGLLHDASEAYLCDIARPIKHSPTMKGYREAERTLQATIAAKFGLPIVQPKEVEVVDTALLVTEARDLGLLTPEWEHYNAEPLTLIIHPQSPKDAERCFLEWFDVIARWQ